jgi:hypothetical protein
MRAQTGLVVFCGNRRGAPILDAYEQLLSPYRQRRYQQLGILHAFCPHCQRWRVHGHALGEGKTVRRASHCVESLLSQRAIRCESLGRGVMRSAVSVTDATNHQPHANLSYSTDLLPPSGPAGQVTRLPESARASPRGREKMLLEPSLRRLRAGQKILLTTSNLGKGG